MAKCIVTNCLNDSNEGQFLGPLCTPCAKALQSGYSPASAQRIIKSVLKGMTGWTEG